MGESGRDGGPPAAIVDVDGTLVDTNYHHALAWYRAFRQHGITPPMWRLHRHVGMGGDQYVAAVAGRRVEEEHGDALREAWNVLFLDMIDETGPLPGARELIGELKRRGHVVVLASSAKDDHLEHYLDVLGARDLADSWTSSADVEATKPRPDLVLAALEKAGGGNAVMVGDSTWDCEAAARAGVPTIGLLTGGFGRQELLDAGAESVHDSLVALRDDLDATALSAVLGAGAAPPGGGRPG